MKGGGKVSRLHLPGDDGEKTGLALRIDRAVREHAPAGWKCDPVREKEGRALIMHSWHIQLLRVVVPSLVRKWEARIGVEVQEYFLHRMKTNWGSCNFVRLGEPVGAVSERDPDLAPVRRCQG